MTKGYHHIAQAGGCSLGMRSAQEMEWLEEQCACHKDSVSRVGAVIRATGADVKSESQCSEFCLII